MDAPTIVVKPGDGRIFCIYHATANWGEGFKNRKARVMIMSPADFAWDARDDEWRTLVDTEGVEVAAVAVGRVAKGREGNSPECAELDHPSEREEWV